MKKILTVVGARPQFIKASVVSHAISQHGGLRGVVVHTAALRIAARLGADLAA